MSEIQIPDWIEPRSYQQEAIRAWLLENGRGILNMATGTGKTVTALSAAAHTINQLDGKLALIIAVPYQHLVDQWAESVQDFGWDPIKAYQSRREWQEPLEREFVEFNLGVRDSLVVITTHTTFASSPFQTSLERLSNVKTMLIADEVHHLGAPHLRTGLPDQVPLRLGLSATPKRWYDEEGTEKLFSYFGTGIVYEYSLQKAIDEGHLCEYYYLPHIIELTEEEAETYTALSRKIANLASRMDEDLGDADLQENTGLKQALFRRARLIGTAENKLSVLKELLAAEDEIEYTLVYCGDGSVEDDVSGETQRHVDAAVSLLRDDLGIRARRFTARESQQNRERLLEEFDEGTVKALVAIRCLDEGVDVPATQTAYMLASSSNPRQFIQRRGRILRTHANKDFAVIHDFVVRPPTRRHSELLDADQFNTERRLIKKELQRVNTFVKAARNHPDAEVEGLPSSRGSIQELKSEFNLLQI